MEELKRIRAKAACNKEQFNTEEIQPIWYRFEDVPFCTPTCPSFDGKRCKLIGCRPAEICIPVIQKLTRQVER